MYWLCTIYMYVHVCGRGGGEEVVLCPCMPYNCLVFYVVTYHNRFSVCVGAQNTFVAVLQILHCIELMQWAALGQEYMYCEVQYSWPSWYVLQ